MKIRKNKLLIRFLAFLMGIVGFFILAATFYPILKYEVLSRDKYPLFLVPLTESDIDFFSGKDYTKASNWFEGGLRKEDFNLPKVTFYNLSIPKLRIENAVVAIGGEDLNDHLIQYPGTALPGRRGNAVIFGHSILPRFYDPKKYISIFSLLPTLEKGDSIYVYFDGIEYTYRVEDMFEVAPSDIQVLEQNSSDSYLTLVTCTPPGDPRKPRRLVVRAKIVSQDSAGVLDSSNL
jgi:sortase A